MQQYEILVIVDPESDDEAVGAVVDRITGILGEHEGQVVSVDRWGKRKLAFRINKKTEGHYVLMAFTAEASALAEIDRILSVADEVIRFKVTRTAA